MCVLAGKEVEQRRLTGIGELWLKFSEVWQIFLVFRLTQIDSRSPFSSRVLLLSDTEIKEGDGARGKPFYCTLGAEVLCSRHNGSGKGSNWNMNHHVLVLWCETHVELSKNTDVQINVLPSVVGETRKRCNTLSFNICNFFFFFWLLVFFDTVFP